MMYLLASTYQTWWIGQHLSVLAFIFAFGGCVGSFLNVVIYRLPAGMGVINPPSRCPICGGRIRFIPDNIPIISWFLLRGKCRFCKAKISSQYMLVELLMACVFAGLYIALYMVSPETPIFGSIGGEWWYSYHRIGFFHTWPAFIALAFLLAGLFAMTMIDARTFTIPIQIPLFVTITAFIAYPVQSILPAVHRDPSLWPIPVTTNWAWFCAVAGGMLGIVISTVLLKLGLLRYSFADYHEYVNEDDVIGDYPHARREMWVELKFLAPCLVGVSLGWFLGVALPDDAPPRIVQAIGGTFAGYIVGGGLVWAIRILGTLAFGREAMGIGDVHLLACVGAVLGWVDPILVFFIAPFFGLAWHIGSAGVSSLFRKTRRELPYGPHLALATVFVIVGRDLLDLVLESLFRFSAEGGGLRVAAIVLDGWCEAAGASIVIRSIIW
jgi:leader peptidase (prepilin peptidase) / N-methyltransferase